MTDATPRNVLILGSFQWIAKQMNLASFLRIADPIFADASIQVTIVGDAPTDFLAKWKLDLRATQFLGFVDDLDKAFELSRMGLVIDAVGGGFKFKILDYDFNRVPVAAVDTATMGAKNLRDSFVTAPGPAALATKVLSTIDDLGRLNSMQERAFDVASATFDWDRTAQRFTSLFEADAPSSTVQA
ncbi:MAG: glycosyltransferase [Pseudomonadota bacterium]